MKVLCTVLNGKPETLLQLNLFTIGVLLCLQWRILAVAYLLNVKILAANSDKCKHFCSGHKLYIREQEGLKRVLYIFGSLSFLFWFGQHPTFPHQPATNQCLCSVDIFGFAASKQGEAFILVVHQTEDASLLVPVAASSIEETGPHPTSPISSSHHCFVLSPSAHLMDQLWLSSSFIFLPFFLNHTFFYVLAASSLWVEISIINRSGTCLIPTSSSPKFWRRH